MRVAVVQGGPSPEAEVSRASARAVSAGLEQAGHRVKRLELNADLPAQLLGFVPDVVFPAVHGARGEDGCLQGLLEVLGFPYVGSDVRASAISADKKAAKLHFAAAGLEVARDRVLDDSARSEPPERLLAELREQLGEAFLLKPMQGGSTLGMSRMLSETTPFEFSEALSLALQHDQRVLVEEFISGIELTCGVLDTAEPRALPPVQVTAQATAWLDFQSKYQEGGCAHQCPAPLAAAVLERIGQAALRAHRAVGARDLSRCDFLLTAADRLVLLEINTLPGMTERSLFPDAAAAENIGFSRLVDDLVVYAHKRGASSLRAQAPSLPGA